MRTAFTLLGALLTLSSVGCYNPALPDQPFLCDLPRGKGTCPDGYQCYGGICGKKMPDCLSHADPQYDSWTSNDSDLEPNNHPELAVTLPCGDNPNPNVNPGYYTQCITRSGVTNGLTKLLICPIGDVDLYKIYLLANETISFAIATKYSASPPRDIDARIWRWDFVQNDYVTVTEGVSTNNDEVLNFSTATATGNPEGWYYLEIFGKSADPDPTKGDVNEYAITFTLNATDTP
jgi:hypothetical protein